MTQWRLRGGSSKGCLPFGAARTRRWLVRQRSTPGTPSPSCRCTPVAAPMLDFLADARPVLLEPWNYRALRHPGQHLRPVSRELGRDEQPAPPPSPQVRASSSSLTSRDPKSLASSWCQMHQRTHRQGQPARTIHSKRHGAIFDTDQLETPNPAPFPKNVTTRRRTNFKIQKFKIWRSMSKLSSDR